MAAPMLQHLLFSRHQALGVWGKYVRVLQFSAKAVKSNIRPKGTGDKIVKDPFSNAIDTLPEIPHRQLNSKKKKQTSFAATGKYSDKLSLERKKTATTSTSELLKNNSDLTQAPTLMNKTDELLTKRDFHGRQICINNPTFFSRKMLNVNYGFERTENKEKNLILHGTKTITYALEAGFSPSELYIAEDRKPKMDAFLSKYADLLKETTVYWLQQNYLKSWYKEDIFVSGVFVKPEINLEDVEHENKYPLTLVLDKVKDTKEVGQLIHCAYENKCENVYVLTNCSDPWSNNAVSYGKGAHFKMPLSEQMTWTDVLASLPSERTFIAVGTNQATEKKLICDENAFVDDKIEIARESEWFGEEEDPVSTQCRLDVGPTSKRRLKRRFDIGPTSSKSYALSEDSLNDTDDEFSDTETSKDEDIPAEYRTVPLHVENVDRVDFTSDQCVVVVSDKGLTDATRRHVYDSYGVAVESPGDYATNTSKRLKFVEYILRKANQDFENFTKQVDP